MTRDEHLAWCIARALDYVEAGRLDFALASLGSDLRKHPDTAVVPVERLVTGIRLALADDADGLRRWIEDFRL